MLPQIEINHTKSPSVIIGILHYMACGNNGQTVCQYRKGNGSIASDTRKPVSYDCRLASNLVFLSAKIDAFFLVNCIPLLGAS